MKHIYNYRCALALLGVGCVNIHIEEVIYKLVVKDDDGWSDIPWWVPQLRLPSFPQMLHVLPLGQNNQTGHILILMALVCKSLILVGPIYGGLFVKHFLSCLAYLQIFSY